METSDRSSTRFSCVQNGISVIALSNVEYSVSHKFNEDFTNVGRLCSVSRYSKIQQFLRYIKRLPSYQYGIVLLESLESTILKNIITRLQQCRQIKVIFIVKSSTTIDKNENNSLFDLYDDNDVNRTIESFNEHEEMFNRLQELISVTKNRVEVKNAFITLNPKQKSLRDLRQQMGPFLWTHTSRLILVATPHNSAEAKDQMLKACRKWCDNDRFALNEINEFEQTYRSCDAIKWYTKPCFLYRLINNALRSEDPFVLYTFRYFIFDLSLQLAIERPTSSEPFYLYRGTTISREEVEQLGIGSFVAVNGFFSSSRNRQVAETFGGICPITGKSPSCSRNDNEQYVLFQILVDCKSSPDCVVADARTQSYIEDEDEMIFDLGTTFVITNIVYDEEHFLWNIQIEYSSEVAELAKEYNTYVTERLKEFDPNILFGRILTTNLAEYSHALTFFHFLLRTMPLDSEERPNIYYELARTYRFIGKHQRAIEYFRAALLLQRRQLPQSKFAYAVTLAALGTVYLEIEDSKKALDVFNKATICFSDYPVDYNYETIFHPNRLSYAYYLEHQYEKARDILMPAFDIYKRKMPRDHPSHAQAWHNMGLIQRALGNHDEALANFKEALRMRKARLSDDHPYIARTHYQMSLLYEEMGQTQLAIQHAKDALTVRKLRLPPKHNEYVESLQLLERLISPKT